MKKLLEEFDRLLPGIDAKSIWEKVKINHAKLLTCSRHDFVANERRAVCSKCGGEVSGSDAHYYKLGLEHAKNV